MSLVLLLALASAAPAPAATPPPLRFACDAAAHALLWERDDATLRASDAGLELAETPVVSPAKPLAPPAAPSVIAVPTPEGTLTLRGVQVESCEGQRCSPVTRMPVSVWAAAIDGGVVLLAAGAPQPGLYRASVLHLDSPELLVAGEVLTLCPGSDGAWALIMRGAGATLVAARGDSPTVTTLDFDEALAEAARRAAPIGALHRALAWSGSRDLPLAPLRRVALIVARDPRPEARALAAGILSRDPGAAAAAALDALAHDPSPEVRRASLTAVVAARLELPPRDAAARLFAFVPDAEQDISWRARDGLLDLAPELALVGASRAYKLDALSILGETAARSGIASIRASLRLLAADEDPIVRQAAGELQTSVEP